MNQIKVLIFDVQNAMKKKKGGVKKIRGEIPNFHGLNIYLRLFQNPDS